MSSEDLFEEEEHIEDDGEAIWLMSLADMMTLLFTLFVVMYSSSIAQKQNISSGIAESMAKTFGGKVEKAHGDLAEEIKKLIEKLGAQGEVQVASNFDGTTITFSSTILFASGSAQIAESFRATMAIIVGKIRQAAPNDKIIVEGHTDDVPIRSLRYPSNWELSSARAATLIRRFEDVGFAKDKLSAVGYSDTRPLLPNRSPANEPIFENMAKNRRVVVKILR